MIQPTIASPPVFSKKCGTHTVYAKKGIKFSSLLQKAGPELVEDDAGRDFGGKRNVIVMITAWAK